MKIAIIGSGISGLGAAHRLAPRHEVSVFEADERLGGHTHTVTAREADREFGVDTGFIVYNERTYPELVALFAELGVATQASEMSLSVRCRRCRVEWSGNGARGIFAKATSIVRASHWRMLVDILRFNRAALRAADDPSLDEMTLGDFLTTGNYGRELAAHYLLPMGAAIWSAETAAFERFPLRYFLGFARNHGLLSVSDHPQWRTVRGGSREYLKPLTAPFADRIRVGCGVRSLRRVDEGVDLRLIDGTTERFDRVVVATHSPQALQLLEDASDREVQALAAIRYQPNEAILHNDESVLPRPAARAAWNVDVDDCRETATPLRMTYFMNRLQRFESDRIYGVTLNDDGRIDTSKILRRIPYEHPVYGFETLAAQQSLRESSGRGGVHFAGAYLGYGFHEDGLRSGLQAASEIEAGA